MKVTSLLNICRKKANKLIKHVFFETEKEVVGYMMSSYNFVFLESHSEVCVVTSQPKGPGLESVAQQGAFCGVCIPGFSSDPPATSHSSKTYTRFTDTLTSCTDSFLIFYME